jgi:hypothetical protein
VLKAGQWRSAWPLARGSTFGAKRLGARRRAASVCRGSRAAAATNSGQQRREMPSREASGRSSRTTERMTSGPDAISDFH